MPKVVREDIDNLNAVVTVTLEKADYEAKYNAELNKYRRQAQIKGFRKGKTPLSVLKKMYGKAVLGEVVNEMLQEEMRKFITDEDLEFLGQPMPSEGQDPVDFDVKNLEDYEFKFDFGLTPQFEIQGLDKNNEFEKYAVEIPDEDVTEQLEQARRQSGENRSIDSEIESGDVVKLSLVELEDGAPKADGVAAETTIMVDRMPENLQEKIIGLKKDDIFEVNPFELEENTDENYVRKYLLGLDQDDDRTVNTTFQATITEVTRMEKSALDQAFFDKFFGEGEVSDETTAREKIREFLSRNYDRQAEALLFRDFQDDLLEKNPLELPDDFLKRWILFNNQKATVEDIEAAYENFAKNLTWTIIRSKIVKEKGIQVGETEIVEYFKDQVRGYFAGAGFSDENLIESMALRFMQDEKQVDKAYQEILTEKLFDAVSESVQVNPKPVSKEEFEAIVEKFRKEAEKEEELIATIDEEE